jgi:hypothetical protein
MRNRLAAMGYLGDNKIASTSNSSGDSATATASNTAANTPANSNTEQQMAISATGAALTATPQQKETSFAIHIYSKVLQRQT